jgi:hypothetical protein
MTVRSSAHGVIVLEGLCPSEDAEILLQQLAGTPAASVDIRRCESAHTAVIQVLMAFSPKLHGPPPESPTWRWVHPSLNRQQ